MSDPIAVVATLRCRPGSRPTVQEALHDAVAATRQEAGCEQYVLHEDPKLPDRLVMIERWRDAEALAAHLRGPAFQTLVKVLDGHADLDVQELRPLD